MKEPTVIGVHHDGPSVALELYIPEALDYFAGHFPRTPILPGVVQLHWAVAYAHRYLGVDGDFAGMEAVKFQQVIEPEQTVWLVLEFKTEKNKLYFRYQTDEATCSTGRIALVNANG